jgi:hypothetical protein
MQWVFVKAKQSSAHEHTFYYERKPFVDLFHKHLIKNLASLVMGYVCETIRITMTWYYSDHNTLDLLSVGCYLEDSPSTYPDGQWFQDRWRWDYWQWSSETNWHQAKRWKSNAIWSTQDASELSRFINDSLSIEDAMNRFLLILANLET